MSTLQSELERLYRPHARNAPGLQDTEPGLMVQDGSVRALVLELGRPADWTLLSVVWHGVQTDLEWPAPAIAVSGHDALQLWFSFQEPVCALQAGSLLESLQVRYLGQIAAGRISKWPCGDASNLAIVQNALEIPALNQATGRWSAFVAPDLAAIFGPEPWLDLPPNPQAQAKVLSRLECIKPAAFQTALQRLSPGTGVEPLATPSIRDEETDHQPSQ